MLIRAERPGDAAAIRRVIAAAFADAPHSSGTEADIVDALRAAGALTVSLVALDDEEIIAHIAISPVRIDQATGSWFGLGPVTVDPAVQRRGIGEALIRRALADLQRLGATGCVVLGDPLYYARFGFRHDPRLTYAEVPPPYFQYLSFDGSRPRGSVVYHSAFG
jgi:predicted N-acetyltransferase YhbS